MSFISANVFRCQQCKLLFLIIFLSSSHCPLPREISAVFSNASCQFSLLFFFRMKGFRLFISSDISLPYMVNAYLYSFSVLLLSFLHYFECFSPICITWTKSYIFLYVCNITFSIFLNPPPQSSGILLSQSPSSKPPGTQAAAVPPERASLALRITDDFCQTFCWIYSHSFCPWLICLCHRFLSYFSFSVALDYCLNSTQLVFHAHVSPIMPWPLLLTVGSDNEYSE